MAHNKLHIVRPMSKNPSYDGDNTLKGKSRQDYRTTRNLYKYVAQLMMGRLDVLMIVKNLATFYLDLELVLKVTSSQWAEF